MFFESVRSMVSYIPASVKLRFTGWIDSSFIWYWNILYYIHSLLSLLSNTIHMDNYAFFFPGWSILDIYLSLTVNTGKIAYTVTVHTHN